MTSKKHLWILLTFTLIASLATINMPVKAEDQVKIYISPEPPTLIPSVDVGQDLLVDVYIESPAEWTNTNTSDGHGGIVGWAFDVIVDPTVLQPVTIYAGGSRTYWLYRFVDDYYPGGTTSLVKLVYPGNFTDASEQIVSWDLDPIWAHGAGGNGKLCTLKFTVLSAQFTEIEIINAYYYIADVKYPVNIVGNGWYQTPPLLEANLAGRSAWKEHSHFDRSKHGNESVPDAKGTPGYQTLFAKIQNYGEDNVTVLAQFRLEWGDAVYDESFNTSMAEIAPGEKIVLTFDFAGKDGSPPWDLEDEGTWKIEAKCYYYDWLLETWKVGTKIKTTKFNCVA